MRLRAVALLALGTPGLAACGSPAPSPSPSIKPGLDPCVVGTWRSTGAHGTVNSADGTLHIPLSGGEGTVTVIRRDGTASVTYDGSAAERGTGSDGSTYTISTTGQISGRLQTSAGQATLDISNPNDATQTISKDGVVLQTVHAPPEQVSQYTCTPRTSLAVTTNGITLDSIPAAT